MLFCTFVNKPIALRLQYKFAFCIFYGSIGQTEVLKGSLSEFYSKHIDEKNRFM